MLTFTHPFFLVGAAFLGVPVLLHLMNRQIPRRLVFPSVRFIRRAELPRRGRRRLSDVLVLLLRLLAVLALIAAFARPRWVPNPGEGGAAAAATTVVLLDASASLGGEGRPEAVRAAVDELLEAQTQNDRVGAVISADRVLESLPPDASRQDLESMLARYAPVPVAGKHEPALREAARLLAESAKPVLVVVSDFARNDWQITGSVELPPGTEVRLVDVAERELRSAGIVDAVASRTGAGLRLTVRVRNFSRAALETELRAGTGAGAVAKAVSLPPLATRSLSLQLTEAPPGGEVAVSLRPDEYTPDDTFCLWGGETPPVRVLLVAPVTQAPASGDSLFFVRKALQLNDESAGVTYFPDFMESDFFTAADLDDAAAVFVLGACGFFGNADFAKLAAYVKVGGTAIITPGEVASQGFRGLRQAGLCNLGAVTVSDERGAKREVRGLAEIRERSFLAETFVDPARTDLFLFPIRRFAMFEPPAGAVTHLYMDDDLPGLVECPAGEGRVFVWAFGFESAWSDIALTQSFVPLVRELAAAAVPEGHGIARVSCGVPPAEVLRRIFPRGELPDMELRTDRPGAFTVGAKIVEVNVDRRESVQAKAGLFELRRRLGPSSAPDGNGAAPPRISAGAVGVRDLWPHAAAAGVGLLLLELLTAWLLDRNEVRGRGKRTVTVAEEPRGVSES